MKISFVAVLALLLLVSPSLARAAGTVEMWWPKEGAELTGLQPLKGIQSGYAVGDYTMSWQVDGGVSTLMPTSMVDYPHKEIMVDFSKWNWRNTGPYKITFKTKNNAGVVLAETSINVYTGPKTATSTIGVSIVVPAVQPAPTLASAGDIQTPLNVWWPTDRTRVIGSVTAKVVAENRRLADYSMTWSVDGGVENPMTDSLVDAPHKVATIDVSGWNWNGTNPYNLTFTARNKATGVIIGKAARTIFVDKPASVLPVSSPLLPTLNNSTNPLAGKKLYVDPNTTAAKQVSAWTQSRPSDAALMQKIARNPHPIWLGSWSTDAATSNTITSTIAAARNSGSVPTFVIYNIPQRDCGSYSAGGTSNAQTYSAWIDIVAKAIGRNTAIIIMEPDALSQIDCLSDSGEAERLLMLKNAVTTLKTQTSGVVYIDAGHGNWIPVTEMSERLKKAAVGIADGFSLNVSNFDTTAATTAYGKEISAKLDNKSFVVDTSRNGLGSNGQWCNPAGRALGQAPTTNTGVAQVDAYLWLKVPGESDGACNGGPTAGSWWADYALGLAARANW